MTSRKLEDHHWRDIRAAYEGEEPNVSSLAARYGISRALLQRRARAEGWVKGPAPAPGRSPARAPVPSPTPRVIDRAAQARVMLRQQREWDRTSGLIAEALDALSAASARDVSPFDWPHAGQDSPSPIAREKLAGARIETLHRTAHLLATKQHSEREAYGIDLQALPQTDPASAEVQAWFRHKIAYLTALALGAKRRGINLDEIAGMTMIPSP